ncbi:zinc metalloprotease [Portibacter marinus]|uniref:zinc metalloprotease n=1 Tax=Portibacter marinus TaxID=2898660 RepID=UPI001F473B79|nr:zinc metalloprotease [Portibacter marinus]
MTLKIPSIYRVFVILILISISAITQNINAQEACGTHESYLEMMKNDPVFRKKQELSKQQASARSNVQGIVTIPVVFHVVYNNADENVSDEQIYSQLEVLNEDFGNVITSPTMWHEVAANPEIEFCLATRDALGNASCGITRTYTDSTEFVIQTSIKDESTGGISGWPARQYMNIFICDIRNVRGYATFPDAEDSIDGIVIDYLSFGRGPEYVFDSPNYSSGRTGTHEVGHWLRLDHIWGDGNCDVDDGLTDTPNASGPNYGCNENAPACNNQSPGYAGPLICMVQNYMDYSDDDCMNLFTQDQVNLMRNNFDEQGSRVSILSSKGCDLPAENELYFALTFDEFPEDIRWELHDASNNIIASDGNFEPGNYDLNIPAPLANKTKTYTWDLPDGNYTLKFFDDFGDGFPDGSYEIKSIFGETVISGAGIPFDQSEMSVPFSVNNAKYRFLGTVGNDWYDPANWNRKGVPSKCYQGDLIIEKECMVEKLTIDQQRNLIIRNEARFTITG